MTHPTKRRTFSRDEFEGSRRAWDAGDFSDEWKPWRHMAAMDAGIIRPPSGTKWDSWSDDEPSERALLVRAMRETPDALRDAIRSPGVHSWSAVIAIVTRGRDRRMEQVEDAERDWERAKERRRSGATAARDIVATIRDSLGMEDD